MLHFFPLCCIRKLKPCFSALFWRVDDDSCDLDLNDTILRAQDTIVHATERQQPEEDLRLVEKAIIHL